MSNQDKMANLSDNIIYKINKMPYDIRELIYYKYLQLEITHILNSSESRCLNYKPLYNLFINYNIINNKNIINNLRETYQFFDYIYKYHYIDNKNTFINFKKLNSLCLTWLMYLYH